MRMTMSAVVPVSTSSILSRRNCLTWKDVPRDRRPVSSRMVPQDGGRSRRRSSTTIQIFADVRAPRVLGEVRAASLLGDAEHAVGFLEPPGERVLGLHARRLGE